MMDDVAAAGRLPVATPEHAVPLRAFPGGPVVGTATTFTDDVGNLCAEIVIDADTPEGDAARAAVSFVPGWSVSVS